MSARATAPVGPILFPLRERLTRHEGRTACAGASKSVNVRAEDVLENVPRTSRLPPRTPHSSSRRLINLAFGILGGKVTRYTLGDPGPSVGDRGRLEKDGLGEMLSGVPAPFGLGELWPFIDTPRAEGVENPLGGRPSVDREPAVPLKYDVDPPSDIRGVLGEMGVNDGDTSVDDFG